jgi:hypothetical protein
MADSPEDDVIRTMEDALKLRSAVVAMSRREQWGTCDGGTFG